MPDFKEKKMKKAMMLAVMLGVLAVGVSWAGEDGKSADLSLTGEVVCLSCYLGHDAVGEAHAKCAKQCFENGLPIGLEVGGKLHLAVGGHHTTANKQLAVHAGRQVTVTGRVFEKDGMSMVEVKSVKISGAEKEAKDEKLEKSAGKDGKTYTCSMCGGSFDKPGKCPQCGMETIEVKGGGHHH